MRYFALAVIAIAFFGMLARPLVLNQVPVDSDLGKYHLPLRDFYQKCLHNGDDPAWCPHLFCGYDCHGEGQAGFDHPWHRLLYLSLPLVTAFNVEIFANYVVLFLGMYVLLRRHRLPGDAALAGALTAAFSGFTLPHYAHTNAIAIVAHIPWLLWSADILFRDDNRSRRASAGLAIALLTGSQILLGYPQYVYFSGVAEAVYVLVLFFHRDAFAHSPTPAGFAGGEGGVRGVNNRWTALAAWLLWKLLGVAIGGAQLLPSLQALSLSPRLDYGREFRGMLSLEPAMLLQLIAPTRFNEFMQVSERTVYGGALATLGAAFFLFAFTNRARIRATASAPLTQISDAAILNRWALCMILIAVPLALGRYTPLFKLYLKLPIVGVFRCPCRYLVLSHLAAAVVVARLVQRIHESNVQSWRRLLPLLIVPALSWTLVGSWWCDYLSADSRQFIASDSFGWIGAFSLTMGTLLLIAAGRKWSGALPLLLLAGFCDLGLWDFRAWNIGNVDAYHFVNLETYKIEQSPPPGDPPDRVNIGDVAGDGLMLLDWSYTSGYVGLTPPRHLDYSDEAVQEFAATQWRFNGKQWMRIAGLPRLRFESGQGEVRIAADRPGQVELTTRTSSPEKLIFAESFHPSWHVSIDGQSAELLRLNTDFQGVSVPSGEHRVEFHFDPARRTLGRQVSIAAIALSVLLALWLARRGRSTMNEHT